MRITVLQGDITREQVDTIVNAANSGLRGGGGVDDSIHRAAGPELMQECDKIRASQGGCPTGSAVITPAGNLPCRYVIHAVGPKMGEGDEDRKLSAAVRSSLALADRHGLKSVAIPAISTGNYGFPVERCARILLTEVHRYLQGGTKLQRVIVCLFDEATWKLFARELRRGFR